MTPQELVNDLLHRMSDPTSPPESLPNGRARLTVCVLAVKFGIEMDAPNTQGETVTPDSGPIVTCPYCGKRRNPDEIGVSLCPHCEQPDFASKYVSYS